MYYTMTSSFCKFLFGLHRKSDEGCHEKMVTVLPLVIYLFFSRNCDITL